MSVSRGEGFGDSIKPSGGFRGGSEVSMEPPFLAKSNYRPLYKSYGSRLVLDFMEPSLPSSYKKTLALAYLRVILNEYWSIGKRWAGSSTMQRIRSCASFIKVGVANAQMGVALKFSRALYALSLIEPSFG